MAGKEEMINDIFKLGLIQGEHNIKWEYDEYNRLPHCKDYYKKINAIEKKYGINYESFIEKDEDEDEYKLLDRKAFYLLETIMEYIIDELLSQ